MCICSRLCRCGRVKIASSKHTYMDARFLITRAFTSAVPQLGVSKTVSQNASLMVILFMLCDSVSSTVNIENAIDAMCGGNHCFVCCILVSFGTAGWNYLQRCDLAVLVHNTCALPVEFVATDSLQGSLVRKNAHAFCRIDFHCPLSRNSGRECSFSLLRLFRARCNTSLSDSAADLPDADRHLYVELLEMINGGEQHVVDAHSSPAELFLQLKHTLVAPLATGSQSVLVTHPYCWQQRQRSKKYIQNVGRCPSEGGLPTAHCYLGFCVCDLCWQRLWP